MLATVSPELAEWANRKKWQINREVGYVYTTPTEDRVIRVYDAGPDLFEVQVCEPDGGIIYLVETSAGHCTSVVRSATIAIRYRVQLAERTRADMIAVLRGVDRRYLDYLRRDLALRDQAHGLLIESIADAIQPRTKSLTCEDVRYQLRSIRNVDHGAEILAKIHGPELEKLRRFLRVPAGDEGRVRSYILSAAIHQEV